MVTWKINNLQRYTESGAVCRVFYEVGIYEGEATVESEFHELDLIGDVTIPYADLTEAIVLGWVKDELGAEDVAAKEESVSNLAVPCAGITEGKPW